MTVALKHYANFTDHIDQFRRFDEQQKSKIYFFVVNKVLINKET